MTRTENEGNTKNLTNGPFKKTKSKRRNNLKYKDKLTCKVYSVYK